MRGRGRRMIKIEKLVLMQNGDFVPLVEAGIDLLAIGNEARPQYLQ